MSSRDKQKESEKIMSEKKDMLKKETEIEQTLNKIKSEREKIDLESLKEDQRNFRLEQLHKRKHEQMESARRNLECILKIHQAVGSGTMKLGNVEKESLETATRKCIEVLGLIC